MVVGGRPLVTVVCPTYGRPQFVEQAVRLFLAQTWTRSELIVIDDSPKDLQCSIASSPRVKVVRLDHKVTLGEKHNLGHELGQGDVFAYQDDDDFFGPRRLVKQLEPIVLEEVEVVGMLRDYVLVLPTCSWFKFNYAPLPAKAWIGNGLANFKLPFHDGTAMYTRHAAELGVVHPALDMNQKVQFLNGLADLGVRWKAIPTEQHFVYVRHGRNTWQFNEQRRLVPTGRPHWFTTTMQAWYEGRAA
jgi:glycosyltransferase involved in cell wall biosynthesis